MINQVCFGGTLFSGKPFVRVSDIHGIMESFYLPLNPNISTNDLLTSKKTSFGPLNGVWATEWYAYFSTIKHNITSFTKRLTPPASSTHSLLLLHMTRKRDFWDPCRKIGMHVCMCVQIYIYIYTCIYITCMYVCIWFIYVECWNSQSSIFSI